MEEKNDPGAQGDGKKADESPPPGPERLTPRAWAEKLGLVFKPNQRISSALRGAKSTAGTNMPQTEGRSHWTFAAADKLFGWSDHAYHYEQDPKAEKFLMTKEEFAGALKAAAAFPAHDGALPASAIPESQRERLAKYDSTKKKAESA